MTSQAYPTIKKVSLWEHDGKYYQRVSQSQLSDLPEAARIFQPEGQNKVGFFVPAPLSENGKPTE